MVAVEDGFRLVSAFAGSREGYSAREEPPVAEVTSFAPALFAPELVEEIDADSPRFKD